MESAQFNGKEDEKRLSVSSQGTGPGVTNMAADLSYRRRY